jgi:predicted pyridoxine 5'-phosphate oxidase superfamily flavin-nucleotide-binding protein
MKFHSGEIAVQTRAGVRETAADVGEGIYDLIPQSAGKFLALRGMLVLASVDPRGRAWASVITGPPGFIAMVDEHNLRVDALPPDGDPLLESLAVEGHVGLFAPDFVASRRIRLNGRGRISEGSILIHAEQVYGNCRRYMQERSLGAARPSGKSGSGAVRARRLSPRDSQQISSADTFFIATDHPEAGADASHKGGNPGFVRVIDDRHLTFPDYNGNSMFNTLGNIAVNPAAGLLCIDFDSGRTLQLTGRASIDWDPNRAREFTGAERLVDFEIDETVANEAGFPLTAKFRQPSRFNP